MIKETQILNPREFVKQIFVPTNRQDILQIFEEERRKIGLSGTDISLLLPEDEEYQSEYDLLGDAIGSEERGYAICLFPRTIREYSCLGHTFRRVIRHELAHIKNGDCDRKLPKILAWLYNTFVEEPKADFYAFFG